MFGALIALGIPGIASASFTHEEYTKFKEADGMKYYVTGVAVGVSWTNAYVRSSGGKPPFCIPDGAAFTPKDADAIISKGAQMVPANVLGGTKVEVLMMLGMGLMYTCK